MNLWILTEERPKLEDIKFILKKPQKLEHKSNFENITIEPDIKITLNTGTLLKEQVLKI